MSRLRCGGSSDSDGQDQGFAGLVTSQDAGPHHSTAPMQQGERCPCAVALPRLMAHRAATPVSCIIAPASLLPIKALNAAIGEISHLHGFNANDDHILQHTAASLRQPNFTLPTARTTRVASLGSPAHPCPQSASVSPAPPSRCCWRGCDRLRGTHAPHRLTAPPGPPVDTRLPSTARAMPSTQASRAAVPPLGPGPHKPSGRTGARRPAAPAGSATTWARAAGQVGIRLTRANPIRRHKAPGRPPALESGRCDTLPVRCHSGWPGATADAHQWAAAGGRRTVRRGRAGGD